MFDSVFTQYPLEKQVALEDAEKALAEVNKKQQEKQALQHLQTEFEGLKPDIQFICDNLAVFAEVWESVSHDLFNVLFFSC